MISAEIAAAIAAMFNWIGPSHHVLDRLFTRAGLRDADPANDSSENIGKMKRVEAVLEYAAAFDEPAGKALVQNLLAALRACGSFRPGTANYPGSDAIQALQDAFDRAGYVLSSDGSPRRKSLENLEGVELTQALTEYVRRALQGDGDAAHLLGTVKDLTEATARHVLVEVMGSYPQWQNFPATLFNAFERLGLPTPKWDLMETLEKDPVRAMQQALFLAACAVNRYRNAEGTGHGRPHLSGATVRDARIAGEIAGVVSELLLETLRSQRGEGRASGAA
jgi:hypothetical protein